MTEPKIVPLVIYVRGERIIIGTAKKFEDGQIVMLLNDDLTDEVKSVISDRSISEFSIRPPFPLTQVPGDTCNCPWNNNYYKYNDYHHINCPSLEGEHEINDSCGLLGHSDPKVT